MSLELYLAFVTAVTALMLLPGPNVALVVANSVAYGTRFGLLTILGTSAAMVPQLMVTALGMTAVLAALAGWFDWLRWLGVGYLLYLGVQHWRAPAVDLAIAAEPKFPLRIVARGFLVSLTNPKTLFFYAAFFPQFVAPGEHLAAQLVLLSATFLALAVAIDSLWAACAGRLRPLLARRTRLPARLSGGFLIGAGIGLALAKRT